MLPATQKSKNSVLDPDADPHHHQNFTTNKLVQSNYSWKFQPNPPVTFYVTCWQTFHPIWQW